MTVANQQVILDQVRAFEFWDRSTGIVKMQAEVSLRQVNDKAREQVGSVLEECEFNMNYALDHGDDSEFLAARHEYSRAQDHYRQVHSAIDRYLERSREVTPPSGLRRSA